MFYCKFCETFQNTIFTKYLGATVSKISQNSHLIEIIDRDLCTKFGSTAATNFQIKASLTDPSGIFQMF